MARAVHAASAVTTPAVGALIAADTPLASIAVLALAIAFHLTGAVLLAAGAPPLAALHAFAAFVVLSIVATSHQLVPVLLRVPPTPWSRTVLPAGGFALGFALLIAAFMGAPLFAAAGTVLAIAAALWCCFIGARIVRAVSERQTALAMGASVASFAAAAWIGVWMAYDFAASRAPEQHLAGMHGVLMIGAFASMLIVAISYRFVPMFSLAHADAYGARAVQWVFFAGALAGAVSGARWAFALALAALILLAYQHVRTLKRRLRKRLDPSLIFGAAAWLLAIAAALDATVAGLRAENAFALVALAVLGWLTITVFGYGLKICGFLSWQLARQRSPESALAPLVDAIPVRIAYAALALLCGGVAGIAAGVPSWGAWIYLVGVLLYALTFSRVAAPYLTVPRRSPT